MVNCLLNLNLILGLTLFVFCNVKGFRSGSGYSGTSCKKGLLLFTDLSHMLFVPCALFVSLFLFWFLLEFLVSQLRIDLWAD